MKLTKNKSMFSASCQNNEIVNLYKSNYVKYDDKKCLDLYTRYKNKLQYAFQNGDLEINEYIDIKRLQIPHYECAMNMLKDRSRGNLTVNIKYEDQEKYPTDVFINLNIKYN
jgi:hypothetical protein